MSRSSFYASDGPGQSDLELMAWYLAEMERIYDEAQQLIADFEGSTTPTYLDDLLDVDVPTPAEGQILSFSSGLWVAADPTSLGLDAGTLTYTPSTLGSWTGGTDPGQIDDALDQLASRIYTLEGATVDASSVGYTPSTLGNWNSSADPGQVDDALDQLAARTKTLETANNPTESIIIACSDETTALTTGTGKVTFRMPYAFTVTAVRASLTTAQTSGSIFTVDINEGGTSILSTKLTIDNTEKTSTTAATAAVISDSSLADDAEMTVDIDQIGDSTAKGLKVVLIGRRT